MNLLNSIGVLVVALAGAAIAWTLWRSRPHRPETSAPATAEVPRSAWCDRLDRTWIVSPEEAQHLILSGATWLDARQFPLPRYRPVRGAVSVRWQWFSRSDAPHRGQLLADDDRLTQQLRAVGVSLDRPVVVMGDATGGWGEEGRIVWMLRSLGHEAAVWVDGGFAALRALGLPRSPGVPPGQFSVRRVGDYSLDLAQVRSRLNSGNITILDSREPREYAGATPYGERRGGHLPGAVLLYYRELLREDGFLKDRDTIRQILRDRGVSGEVVAYCTGGVRSAWLVTVLRSLNLPEVRQAYNYPGSMWEWSARSAADCPLESNENG